MRPLEIAGQRFGRLVALQRLSPDGGKTRWRCDCDCGATTIAKTQNLRAGDTRSCGCIEPAPKHGHNRAGARSRTYGIWAGMLTRCRNPKHRDFIYYGAKGVRVCERWFDFASFLSDMGEAATGMTIDRIDPRGDYEPENCRWITRAENARRACLGWRKHAQRAAHQENQHA